MEVITLRLLNALLRFANYRVGHHQTRRMKLAVLFTHQLFFHLSNQHLLLVCLSNCATFITYILYCTFDNDLVWPHTRNEKHRIPDCYFFHPSSLVSLMLLEAHEFRMPSISTRVEAVRKCGKPRCNASRYIKTYFLDVRTPLGC